jgi:RsiW-degrading membrane proteinase PrsW (M82 family)
MSRLMSPYARLFWSIVLTLLVLIAAVIPSDSDHSPFTWVFIGFALFGLWVAGRAAVRQIERELARKHGHRPYDWEKEGW